MSDNAKKDKLVKEVRDISGTLCKRHQRDDLLNFIVGRRLYFSGLSELSYEDYGIDSADLGHGLVEIFF